MRVRVQGDAAGGVTQAFGDDLGVHAGLEQLGGVRVAQVVETDLEPDVVAARVRPVEEQDFQFTP